jgi:hypothetical protein
MSFRGRRRPAPHRRRRRATVAVAGAVALTVPMAACGEDTNDAPGGSAPTTSPPADTGGIPTDSRVSSDDEGHPSVPGEERSTQPGAADG